MSGPYVRTWVLQYGGRGEVTKVMVDYGSRTLGPDLGPDLDSGHEVLPYPRLQYRGRGVTDGYGNSDRDVRTGVSGPGVYGPCVFVTRSRVVRSI